MHYLLLGAPIVLLHENCHILKIHSMTTTALTIIFTALFSALILYLFFHHYQKLRKSRRRCDTAFNDVENLQAQLISRSTPVIAITQKVLRDEAELFQELRIITTAQGPRSLEERIHSILLLRHKLNKLHRRSLSHVELKDDAELNALWIKVEITNRNIDESASFYNDAVHDYKELISEFPASMLADILQYPTYHRI